MRRRIDGGGRDGRETPAVRCRRFASSFGYFVSTCTLGSFVVLSTAAP
jgi:hypothetical protein